MEPILPAIRARKLLASLQGGTIIAAKTLSRLVAREGLPFHLDPFGTGRRVFLESEIHAWWTKKLVVPGRPIPGPGRPRKPLASQKPPVTPRVAPAEGVVTK